MTTPDERTRAILHTKEFLVELSSAERTPGVPEVVRNEARRLLRHYPGPRELDLAHRTLPIFFGEVPGTMTATPIPS